MLPGFLPRIYAFVTTGFYHMAYIMAVIYQNVGLLPAGHPYLNPHNFGRYGVRHVIAEASNHLVLKKENFDKILIYSTILIGFILLVVQFVLFVLSFLVYPALAGPIANMFLITPVGPQQDIAFVVLDRVFGVMNFLGTDSFFGSCVSGLVPCTDIRGTIIAGVGPFPTPFHMAMHNLMMFYSMGIAWLSGAVILYFVVAIIGETVASGTPFGKRFSRAWFIPRLLVFFALITPMNTLGLNAGISASQFLALGVAKWGSNFATNAWSNFTSDLSFAGTMNDTLLGNKTSLIAEPNVPEVGALTQFMHVARLCMYGEKIVNGIDVFPYLVRPQETKYNNVTATYLPYNPVTPNHHINYLDQVSTHPDPYLNALQFSRYGTVTLRFGHRNPPGGTVGDPNDPPDSYDDEWGYVKPTCGEITFNFSALPTAAGATADPVVTGYNAGGWGIQETYYRMISWYLLTDYVYDETTYCLLQSTLPHGHDPTCVNANLAWTSTYPTGPPQSFNEPTQLLTRTGALDSLSYYDTWNKHLLTGWYYNNATYGLHNPNNIIALLRLNYDYTFPPLIRERGWAGAALWYNKVAEINGAVASAVRNIPQITKYPELMEHIAKQHKTHDVNPSYVDRFNPVLQDGRQADLPRMEEHGLAAAMYASYRYWTEDDINSTTYTNKTGNSITDVVNMILGTSGLYDILENNGTHPLALLSALGKGMVDASIRNLFAGVVGQGLGEIFSGGFIGNMAEVGSGFAFKFGMIGLSIGFVLFYVLPILPFIYFFFAFSGWIKSVFEAVVAMPLWALAHIKIDGQGLPGPWATNGYFLLLEIFLRPILIIFGFLASISLFSALVNGLNDMFHLAVLGSFGFDIEADLFTPTAVSPTQNSTDFWRGPIDEFFITALYTVFVYMTGLSCFKLVDQIPNNIMRWMGVTVSTFQEQAGDPAGQLTGKMFHSSQLMGAQLTTMVSRMKGWKGTMGDATVNAQIALGGGAPPQK